ncbi:MAG: PASTA domain-containing protein [Rhodocyclaceae bacterium]|nr:PASTA domain-containing protein [Rhodocyclaceae bacterium]
MALRNVDALNLNVAASAAGAARETLVDLSPEPAKAKVVREGYQVPAVALDEKKSGFFLDNLKQVPPRAQPRVVSQSIAAGTKVLPGTAVDLVLAPASTIPFDIFEGVHKSLVDRNLTALDPVLDDATVRQTLLKYNAAADVPPADKKIISDALAGAGVTINEDAADTGFGAAFNSARNALAFR